MFKERFTKICDEKGTSPSKVLISLGYSSGLYSQWDDTSVPRKRTLIKIADFLGVSVEYLTGKDTGDGKNFSDELSEQEKSLIEIFRSTSEEGRLEMIAAIVNIKNSIEKKTLLGTPSSFRTNTGA